MDSNEFQEETLSSKYINPILQIILDDPFEAFYVAIVFLLIFSSFKGFIAHIKILKRAFNIGIRHKDFPTLDSKIPFKSGLDSTPTIVSFILVFVHLFIDICRMPVALFRMDFNGAFYLFAFILIEAAIISAIFYIFDEKTQSVKTREIDVSNLKEAMVSVSRDVLIYQAIYTVLMTVLYFVILSKIRFMSYLVLFIGGFNSELIEKWTGKFDRFVILSESEKKCVIKGEFKI